MFLNEMNEWKRIISNMFKFIYYPLKIALEKYFICKTYVERISFKNTKRTLNQQNTFYCTFIEKNEKITKINVVKPCTK